MILDSKLYMILVALIKGFQNHIGFAIIRASGDEWQARNDQNSPYSILYGPLERVKVGGAHGEVTSRSRDRAADGDPP